MGGFILFNKPDSSSIKRAKDVFLRMGFCENSEFNLSGLILLIWKKQILKIQNWVVRPNGVSIFVTGTLSYKKSNFKQSIEFILDDYLTNSLDITKIFGSFCIIIHHQSKIIIITDDAGMYTLFGNAQATILSSSLLAVSVANSSSPKINPQAILETIITGSVIAPDTIFNDIINLDYRTRSNWFMPNVSFINPIYRLDDQSSNKPRNIQIAVEKLIGISIRTIKEFVPLIGNSTPSIGLSGGFDSRLLLALSRKLGVMTAAHTWVSDGNSDNMSIAKQIANQSNISLNSIPVQNWKSLSLENLKKNIFDTIHYWDGRTNDTMGTFNDVHTRRIRLVALGDAVFGLNGIGGELFRNPSRLGSGDFIFNQWFKYFIIGPIGVHSFHNSQSLNDFIELVGYKYAKLSNLNLNKGLNVFDVRKIYTDIQLPFFAGPRLSAENRISFALMPFTHSALTKEALLCTPFIGKGGALEAAMISKLDPILASINSSYGYSFNNIPLKVKLYDSFLASISLSFRNMYWVNKSKNINIGIYDNLVLPKHDSIIKGFHVITDLNLPLNLDYIFADPEHRDRFLFLAGLVGLYC